MKLKCVVEECQTEFLTNELISTGARFVCKEHPRNIQLQVIGREYDPDFDEEDSTLHFQSYQFDKKLDNIPEEDLENLSEDDRYVPWETT